ncbi:DEAD/DEAH box helicase [Thermomonas haemolytica]|uniref:DEAD-box ATP-dependent RNA helicase RhpA n=1 Tax=Thermomonas haemolytica TaxID=141949 RepID=A0A4R3NBC3_9GAMM|nr:DEAD/DEAH box helicase [Thermomonas haemolytica]TCT26104.1 ATP-dependent RNA helicase RhlE [Thermomonas haemolytica]TNY28618.1 RNA helicase [Thermomonas haemolytica]
MSFESLGLAPALLRALAEQGYATPTPIQAQAIPLVLAGHDVLGGAQTGTGKTAAFGLPLLQKLAELPKPEGLRRPRVLVLTPTRELAVQITDNLRAYAKHLRINVTALFGGVGMQPQVEAFRRGVDVLVACPGRLIDHLERGTCKLGDVRMLVLDEADRMLDMGFLPSIKRVMKHVPAQRQTLLFSATFEPRIKALALEFMQDPRQVQVAAQNTVVETIRHHAHPVDAAKKRDLLVDILARRHADQVLVFGKTKHGCNRLAEQLEKAGLPALAIHGNKSQAARQKALSEFKSGRVRILVATDVAARGLDIPQLPLVINHDLPMVAEDYVHRIGRTGRNGASGEAISLVSPDEAGLLRQIQKLLGREITMQTVPGFEPSRAIRTDAAPFADAARGPRPGRNRRPHGKPRSAEAHAHAHTGAKPARDGQGEGRRGGGAQGGRRQAR